MAIIEFTSSEKKEISKLYDMALSIVTERDVSQLTPFMKELDSLGKIADIIGIFNISETILNWNSFEKNATQIFVSLQNDTNNAYTYHAVIDSELMFMEMYAGIYRGNIIEESEPSYQFILSYKGNRV